MEKLEGSIYKMNKKNNFFIKLKDAVFNFDAYKELVIEKTSKTIIYLIILLIAFSITVAMCLTYKFTNISNDQISVGYNKIIGIVTSENANTIEELQENNDYQLEIYILKNKVALRNSQLNMQSDIISGSILGGYIISGITFITFFIEQIIIDLLWISLFAFLLSRIIRLNIKYKYIFNISAYSLTLPILLYLICIIVNLTTGFTIVYFDIAYRAISYVYIITALLIIKGDLIKQNAELTKIVEVQKQVRKEIEQEKEKQKQEEEKEKEKKEDKKKEKKKERTPEGKTPEGTEA